MKTILIEKQTILNVSKDFNSLIGILKKNKEKDNIFFINKNDECILILNEKKENIDINYIFYRKFIEKNSFYDSFFSDYENFKIFFKFYFKTFHNLEVNIDLFYLIVNS
jgi:hypothetical protein